MPCTNRVRLLCVLTLMAGDESSHLAGGLMRSLRAACSLSTLPLTPLLARQELVHFCYNVVKGVLATLAFAVGSFLAARERAGMWASLGCGYAAWFIVFAVLNRYA